MEQPTELYADYLTDVKFSEVDALQIVWHGHYIRYFEDARESFGKKYGIGYSDILEQGFSIPVVEVNCQYKSSLKYGDSIVVRCQFIKTPAAKIIFEYQIKKVGSEQIIAVGKTIQVFLDLKGELQLYLPPYIQKWKTKMKLD